MALREAAMTKRPVAQEVVVQATLPSLAIGHNDLVNPDARRQEVHLSKWTLMRRKKTMKIS
jgi:hypothetical protein